MKTFFATTFELNRTSILPRATSFVETESFARGIMWFGTHEHSSDLRLRCCVLSF